MIAPRTFRAAAIALVATSTWIVARAQEPQHAPPTGDAVFTSTRQVNAFQVGASGELWAATGGGVLRRDPAGMWQRYTRTHGLPSHEALGFAASPVEGSGVIVQFPTARAEFREGTWPRLPGASRAPTAEERGTSTAIRWRGDRWALSLSGLVRLRGEARQEIGMPPGSLGTHPTALCPQDDRLLVAIYGDTIYGWDGHAWRKELPSLPVAAREITALAQSEDSLWIGTRREGVWQYHRGVWTPHLQADEPYDHNIQTLGVYRGSLYASTLEDGLMVRGSGGWSRLGAPQLSSNAPRHVQPFHGSLYLRHGTGQVDRLDRDRWTTNVFRTLPRKQVFALAADEHRLYAAQWGGWSEYDGREWTHFLDLPALQGLPVTALQPNGDTVWIGTQSRGLAEVSRTSRTVRWHDERAGLTDDWITALCRHADALYAGTFVGGLVRYDGQRWTAIPGLTGENVTALGSADPQTLLITTRSGLWQLRGGKLERLNDRVAFLDPEMQAVLPVSGGVWAGARTGLFFLKSPFGD